VAISRELAYFLEHARILWLSDSATEKLARLLLGFGDQLGERTAKGIRLQTMLTHEEMAQMIGASRETVTRSLNILKRKHLISGNGEVLIRNRAALLSLASKSS
ncbi:MAG TPA: helix-turn-helix domain-containing protein, partial [Pyrinomonadaceae bacterium]|nr:helix-turn-helix domain-containing protein [Pyrinomonadaceae bacterium]